jgi:hypothetical protein
MPFGPDHALFAAMPWNISFVHGTRGRTLYAYTYGLFETYGHPELLLRAKPLRSPRTFRLDDWDLAELLDECGRKVRDGDPFFAGEEMDFANHDLSVQLRLRVGKRTSTLTYLTAVEAPVWRLHAEYWPEMTLGSQSIDR